MKHIKFYPLILSLSFLFIACDNLTELNVNPNGVDPSTVNPNLMTTTVLTNTAQTYLSQGYNERLAGVMQYVQKSGWGSDLNNFDWLQEVSWSRNYDILRDVKHLYERAEKEGMEFHQGIALILRSFNFGIIADNWGDAPYTNAINAPVGKPEDLFPVFDSQEMIYKGIIEDLKKANTLLSKPRESYSGIVAEQDVIFRGDLLKWRKFANSLMLRYFMRVSSKLPDFAKAGIEEIVANPDVYPIFTSIKDDATMSYVGSSDADSWPANIKFDNSESNFSRIQLGGGFRDVLVEYNDPRLPVWFSKVEVKITVSDKYAPENDVTVDGVRYLTPGYVASQGYVIYDKSTWQEASENGETIIDTMQYVGIPTAVVGYEPYNYNLNPSPTQGGYNRHVSALSDKYKAAEGPLLKSRLISYAEVCFILSEAAQKGWSAGSQQAWYENGVKASLETWGVQDEYEKYMSQNGVIYDGSLNQIKKKKWIANWTVAHESWCDWKRTGFPVLEFGARGRRNAMPLRYRYDANERNRNAVNYQKAIASLEQTPFTGEDGNDSAWSKTWLLQGTGKPY